MVDKVSIDIRGLDSTIRALQRMPAEIVSKRGGPVRLALAKGARVIRDQARANIRQITSGSTRSTGALAKAVVSTRGRIAAGQKGERQIVWLGKIKKQYVQNRRNTASGKAGKSYLVDSPQFYGRFLEYGTAKMKARPWLRPAFDSKREQAVRVFEADLIARVEKIAQQLLDQGRSGV